MEGSIQKVLDTRGALRCVRFESGNVGVMTTKGKTIDILSGAFFIRIKVLKNFSKYHW